MGDFMQRYCFAVVFALCGSFTSADDAAKPPAGELPTVVDARWVRADGKIMFSMTQVQPETRTTVTTVARVVDGKIITEAVPREYTVMVPVVRTIQADTTGILQGDGKTVDRQDFPSKLAQARTVLLATKELDPAVRDLLRSDALVLVAPSGISTSSVDTSRLPRLAQARIVRLEDGLRLSLVASELVTVKKSVKSMVNGQEVVQEVTATEPQLKTREIIYDGVETQAVTVSGKSLGSREVRKRLKEWTTLLVCTTKPDSSLLASFRDDVLVVVISEGDKSSVQAAAGTTRPATRTPIRPVPVRVLEKRAIERKALPVPEKE